MKIVKNFTLILMYLLVIVSFFNFSGNNAQYRRRHTDVTKDLIKILQEPKPENYYFSLLPPDVCRLVCKMRELDVHSEIGKALANHDKEKVVFLGSLSRAILIQELASFTFLKGNITAARMYVSYVPNWKSNSLCGLAQQGFSSVLKLFLDLGADPNPKEEGNWVHQPLYFAVQEGHKECVKLLLDAGADVNYLTSDWYNYCTPLILASKKNFYDIAKLLIVAQADVNRVANASWSALLFATRNNNLKMVRLLVEHGIDINYVPCASTSPLEEAAINGNVQIVTLLLAAGAKPIISHYSRVEYHRHTETKIKCGKKQRKEIEKLLENAKTPQ